MIINRKIKRDLDVIVLLIVLTVFREGEARDHLFDKIEHLLVLVEINALPALNMFNPTSPPRKLLCVRALPFPPETNNKGVLRWLEVSWHLLFKQSKKDCLSNGSLSKGYQKTIKSSEGFQIRVCVSPF
jgi:hypothetical protein